MQDHCRKISFKELYKTIIHKILSKNIIVKSPFKQKLAHLFQKRKFKLLIQKSYPLRGQILGSGVPGTNAFGATGAINGMKR